MDENKQPGIKCNSIILSESIFRRKPLIPKDQKLNVAFDVRNTISKDDKRLATEIIATVNNEDDPIFLKVTFVGIFDVDNEINMDLKDFAEKNAPAIVFPYIREEIHNRMQKGSLPINLIIPPMNIIALIKTNKKA
jgi:preprotein translocase subunit SecB